MRRRPLWPNFWQRRSTAQAVPAFSAVRICARETSAAIEQALAARGLKFDKREAIELRELQFGLFDGIADEDLPKLFPREYEHYDKHKRFEGEFADRVKGVFGTILRDASSDRSNPVTDFIIVSHGVTIRCFRMQWMHYSWEWYEREKNPRNCSAQLIEGRAGTGYTDQLAFKGFASRHTQQERREEGQVGA